MLKKFIAALAFLFAATAFAAVDANKATQAELESIKGIGPAISGAIISERKKGEFKDWNDLVVRVKGIGETNAGKFSEAGLTVGGKTFSGAAPAATKATAAATAAPATPAAPATTAAPAKSATEATKETAAKTGSAVKHGAEKAASATVAAGKVVKEDAKEQKDAVKQNVADAKAKSAEKKAAKAEKAEKTKAEKAEAMSTAASGAKK
jgi:competence protein ComEA